LGHNFGPHPPLSPNQEMMKVKADVVVGVVVGVVDVVVPEECFA